MASARDTSMDAATGAKDYVKDTLTGAKDSTYDAAANSEVKEGSQQPGTDITGEEKGEKGVLKAVHDWITAPGDGTEDIPGTEGVKPESGNVQSNKQEMDTKEVDEFKRLDEKVKHHTTWEEPEHGQVGDSGTALHTPRNE